MSPKEQVPPFDEQAALAELERLRESIQAARQSRQRISDQFEAFTKGFRNPASTPASDSASARSREPEAPQQVLPESIDPSLPAPDLQSAPVDAPSDTDAFAERIALPPPRVSPRYRLSLRALGIVVIIVLIALGLLSTRWRREVSPPTTAPVVGHSAAPARNTAVLPPAPQSAPAAPTAHAVAIELRVLRPVWMRVVIDGRTEVEGTVQAGEPMHLAGDHSIVVRVGNGGDVLVRSGTRDEPFGDTGQPRTRTFSKP